VKPAVEGAGAMKTDSTVERASTAEPASATESATAAKPATAVKATTTTVKSAASAVKAPATVATTLRESRLNAAKNQKRGDYKKNLQEGFFHFSSSDQATCASRATRDCLCRRKLLYRTFSGRQSNISNSILHPDSAGIEFLRRLKTESSANPSTTENLEG
jgi:hypothetical protein